MLPIEQLFGEPYLELYARKLTPRLGRAWAMRFGALTSCRAMPPTLPVS